jgi:hypothetical protein
VKFILVNGRVPTPRSFCAQCCEPLRRMYLRDVATRLSYCGHKCYVAHCNVSLLALENQARAL